MKQTLFITGTDTGVGKTALALYLQRLIGADKWSTTKHNGTELKIELMEDIAFIGMDVKKHTRFWLVRTTVSMH